MNTAQTSNLVRRTIASLLIVAFVTANAATAVFASANASAPVTRTIETQGLTTDLTQLGREGRLRENLNLEAETLQLIKVLGGNGSRQPMILDEKNEVQDALVEQLAIRIANGNAPALNGKRILKL
jgi:ATP-dependent Clp protease ATP-binding subunit ClpA